MKDLSLYIHIPFCKARCSYCGFITYAGKDQFIKKYIDTLLIEIENKSINFKNKKITSIYFGGGTPSYIDSKDIVLLLKTLRANFNILPDAEITLESNPESITKDNLHIYIKAGINRFSLGIQSLNDKTLKKIGRIHNSKTGIEKAKLLKDVCENYSLDFIIGLPYQTKKIFTNDLDKILGLNPPHLSFYFLSIDNKKINNFIKDCPTEKEQLEIYDHLIKKLKEQGYIHYEVSNYAKPGFECKHNLRYWNQKEYLGLGLAAHSFYDNTVSENEPSLQEYLQNPLKQTSTLKMDKDLLAMDYIMLHLRTTQGINKEDYSKRFNNLKKVMEKADQYFKTGLLINSTSNISPSEKGYLIIDKIIDDLI